MSDPLPSLPDDLEALKAFALAMAERAAHADRLEAEVVALKAHNLDVEARLARLTSFLKSPERARYGKRSERLEPDAAEQLGPSALKRATQSRTICGVTLA